MFEFCRLYWLHAPSSASPARCAPAHTKVFTIRGNEATSFHHLAKLASLCLALHTYNVCGVATHLDNWYTQVTVQDNSKPLADSC